MGRLLLFKECLKYNIVPFIIDELKMFYYRGLSEWTRDLLGTCLNAQDKLKKYLDSEYLIMINLSSTLDNGTCGSKDYKQFFE